ncbi:MAG: hypothetical protein GC172_01325 [Phycisphaera sp.]|nr:hypothetical protein [Phycisphaera sp.]
MPAARTPVAIAVGVIVTLVLSLFAPRADADNAGFALAPRSAEFALDARGMAAVLGPEDAALRPALEALIGEEALRTFDRLAKRGNAAADAVAREIFEGRIALYIVDDARGRPQWMFGVEADDARCERVLKLFDARMQGPGRFVAVAEKLLMRRVGGWLLVTPASHGEAALDAAARRVLAEEAALSLLGEPLMQRFLADESPVRLFIRHDAPLGGATTVALARGPSGLRASVVGEYQTPPLPPPARRVELDAAVLARLEQGAAMVLVHPTAGTAEGIGPIWFTLVPELRASPAMRANLLGERVIAVGAGRDGAMPAIAMAWRIDDAEQARIDQDLYMQGVCCGCERALEADGVSPSVASRPVLVDTAQCSESASDAGAQRACAIVGPFLDKYLGKPFKLGASVLVWATVETPCGGWQVYANDPDWLEAVSAKLKGDPCEQGAKVAAAGLGYCDGARTGELLRTWKPLSLSAPDVPEDRVARGIAAVADALERLGRMRFRYDFPSERTIRAEIEFDERARPASTAPLTPAARGVRP